MPSIWTDLLFLHGHISDTELARSLLCEDAPPPFPPALDCLGLGAIRAVPP